jgi:aryl-alcohol dehydrogenase-like predicted oxidoreductase
VERRELGRSGLLVPAIGLGTYRVFNVSGDAGEARCEAVVDAALEGGANLFDSSPMYGEAERVLAATLADRRDSAIVATKVWAKTRAIGEQQIERALEWFERIDIYQIHNLLAAADHLPFLLHLKEAARISAIGATHYLDSQLGALIELMRGGDIDMVQVPYNVERRAVEAELLPEAERLGVGVLIMEPLDKGRLLDNPPPESALAPLAEFGVQTWSQALLKWALSDPRVTCLIPATSDPDHMRENIAAGSPPWFSPRERDYVAGLVTPP